MAAFLPKNLDEPARAPSWGYRGDIDDFPVLDLVDNHAFYWVSIRSHCHDAGNPPEILSVWQARPGPLVLLWNRPFLSR